MSLEMVEFLKEKSKDYCIGIVSGSDEKKSLVEHIGDAELQKYLNFCLQYLSEVTLPFKRGTFIEVRNAMLNISPVGRGCTTDERNLFEAYDLKHCIRSSMIHALKDKFRHLDFHYSVGGQISFDVFPTGWDKRYCLRQLEKDRLGTIHFFGDKTDPGGNDHEIYMDSRVIGHRVRDPQDTMNQVNEVCLHYGAVCNRKQ
ncbi:hypothetical protein ACOME3_003112 [Neoechinorhynchus agilis]